MKSKKSRSNSRLFVAVGLTVLTISTVIAINIINKNGYIDPSLVRVDNPGSISVAKSVELTPLYPSYKSFDAMLDSKELSLIAKVIVVDNGVSISKKIESGLDIETNSVTTEYKVNIKRVFRGDEASKDVVVSFMGGVSNGTRYYVDGVPSLKKGDEIVIFASVGDDGKYYPLSASTAVAIKDQNGKFILSNHAITNGASFNESDLESIVLQHKV